MKTINKPSLTDYIFILFKWRKFLIINLLVTLLFAVFVALVLPNKYKSTSVVMIPPESTQGLGGLTNLLGGKSAGSSISSRLLGGSNATEDMIFGILDSKTALIKVINKFGLINYYDIDDQNIDNALKAFKNDISFDLTENNFIEIGVINKYPSKSAEIANYFVFVLDSINNWVNTEAARNNRKFIEKRYLKNLADLKIAEDSLFNFQKKYGVISVPDQLELLYKAAAEIEAQLFQKQMEVELLLKLFGENSPQYQMALNSANILEQKVAQLKLPSEVSKKSNIFIPFRELPTISINYLQIYREVEIQSKILEVILPMFEQAKIEEVKNIPTVIVIDKAQSPQIKYRPQRSFIVLSIFFVCLFLLIPFTFRMESLLRKELKHNPFEETEFKIYSSIHRIYRVRDKF